jgi:PAS domain S-box-containing protein
MLVLACALPAVAGFSALSYIHYTREGEAVQLESRRLAQALLTAVDRDLDTAETAARVLALSNHLAKGDFGAFHQQARAVLQPNFPGSAFILSGPDGTPLVDTRFVYGAALPPAGAPERIAAVFRSGETATSNLYRAPPDNAPMVSIDVPVWIKGEVAYVLSTHYQPGQVAELLLAMQLREGWVAQVFDADFVFVGRSVNGKEFIGQKARPEMIAAASARPQGTVELLSREGAPVLSSFARSGARDWLVSIGVPAGAGQALAASVFNIVAALAALLASGLITAYFIGGKISRSVRALSAPAAALGRGESPLLPADVTIHEAAEVADAMQQVGEELQAYRSSLQDLVTERTAELQRSSALLSTVFSSAPLGLAFLDRELRIVMINDYLSNLDGIPVREHIGRTLPELLGPGGEQFEDGFRRVLAGGVPILDLEARGAAPVTPGQQRNWLVSYYPVFDSQRDLVGVSCVVIDITERRAQEQRLRDNEEFFRVLYEESADAHTLLDPAIGFVAANKAAVSLYGSRSMEEFLTMSPQMLSPEFQPDGRRTQDKAREYIEAALAHGVQRFEWLHARVDGKQFHAEVLMTRVLVGGRSLLKGTVRDITERKAAEAALRATSAQLEDSVRFVRTVTDNLPGMIAYWSTDLHCRYSNRLYREWCGLSREEMLGISLDRLDGQGIIERDSPQLLAVLAGRTQHFERELVKLSGELLHTWVSYIPDVDSGGTVQGFYLLVTDISELKRSEMRLQFLNEQLSQALDQAQKASNAKTEFVANMSHEIRTPMNAIMGLARLLEEAPLERRERGYVAKMKMSTSLLLGILNDVLDFSKIEAGQMLLEQTAFKVCDILDAISALLSHNAWSKGIEPVFDVAPGVPMQLIGDPMRLQQVLLNLFSNAIKFTSSGSVLLSVRLLEADGDRARITFSVRDTGIGIEPDRIDQMFGPFSQGDTSTSRKYGGTGLGLAISRRLVDLMGGTITVASAPGKGSEFSFSLIFRTPPDASTLALPEQGYDGWSALVIDDHPQSSAVMETMCKGFGWTVDHASGGAAALEVLRQARARGTAYNIMFLDSTLPDIDGISLLTHARTNEELVLPPFVMMVPDHAREQLAGMAHDLDIQAMISKPIVPQAVVDAIVALHSGDGLPEMWKTLKPLAGRLAGLSILLVEDNEVNQEVALYILQHAGASVDIAGNGKIAVDLLASAPARFNVVLMDIQMPVMNGYEATTAIRRMGLTELPIVAMTANAMESDLKYALDVGMNEHVAKPIDVDLLIETLVRVTRLTPQRQPHQRPPGSAARLATPDDLPELPGLDLHAALPRFGGRLDAYSALLQRFISNHVGAAAELEALLAAGEREAALQLAHRLRGVAANLGATHIGSLTMDIENVLRSGTEAVSEESVAALAQALATVNTSARHLPGRSAEVPANVMDDVDGQLRALVSLLESNNMRALAVWQSIRPAVADRWPADRLTTLSRAIDHLEFASAATLLEAIITGKDSA